MNSDQIALCALLVALLSVFISSRGYILSKKAYVISKKEHDDKYNKVYSYLIDSFKWIKSDRVFVSFAVSYTNQATEPNSLKEIILEIEFYDQSDTFNKAKLMPYVDELPLGLDENYQKLENPLNLSPKETKTGWVSFEIPRINNMLINVEVYRVCAISATNEIAAVEAYMLRSVKSNEKK